MKTHLRAAIDLHEIAGDPLLHDAIRALATRDTPPAVVASVKAYVENTYAAALNLYGNGDKHSLYGYRFDNDQ